MTEELRTNFKEMADFIYEQDEIAIECAMEGAETDGDLCVIFDDYSKFESRLSEVEEACWARGLMIEQEGR